MRTSRVRAKLNRQEPILVTASSFQDPAVFELTSLLGFDAIWLDLEHHVTSLEKAGELMRAARVGTSDIMARPAKGEFLRMSRMLEAGAHGIMYPRCDNAAEAREVVRWAKFPPLGQRGFDGGNADMPYCSMSMTDYLEMANRENFIVIQIEDPQALEHVEEIAAVEGVDIIFLGPGDYSIACGVPGQFEHPKLEAAIDRIAAATQKHGKAWGMPSGSPARTKNLLARGARFIAHGADIIFVKQGLEAIQKDFAPLGFTFDPRLSTTVSAPLV